MACYCGRCHNQSVFGVRSINSVTLFFIPVLPFSFKKRLKCNICGALADLDNEGLERLKRGEPVAIMG